MITLNPGIKNWSCPHKQEARRNTIIWPFVSLFGNSLLPTQQYWTLCGELAPKGQILLGCELDQMVSSGLITPNQFHGVEGNPTIHSSNLSGIQNSQYNQANLYNGEFTDVLDEALCNGKLNPGLVYLDTIQEPKSSSTLFAMTLDILNKTQGPLMVVWNFVKGNRRYGKDYSWEYVQDKLWKNPTYRIAVQHYTQYNTVFSYNGTGRSATIMGSIIMYRK